MIRNPFVLTSIAVTLAAGLWGVYWIPQRMLEAAGLTGGWSTIAQYLVSCVLLLPFAVRRFLRGQQTGLGLPLTGALLGGGIVCYANSFLLTDVIRTMLLFYLTPFWVTLIEWVILRRRPGWWRLLTVPMSLAGVSIVLGSDSGFPIPSNTGDWLAIFGGAIYASGAIRVQHCKVRGVFPILFAFFIYGALVSIAQAMVLSSKLGPLPDPAAWTALLPWLFLLSAVFFIPTNAIISWAPTQISASVFSILILAELIFGSVSAALWADEQFGWHELAGIVLILGAGIVEVVCTPKAGTGLSETGLNEAR